MSVRRATTEHFVIECGVCKRPSALCPKRTIGSLEWATECFLKAKWRLDAGTRKGTMSQDEARKLGIGTWYCPRCQANGIR